MKPWPEINQDIEELPAKIASAYEDVELAELAYKYHRGQKFIEFKKDNQGCTVKELEYRLDSDEYLGKIMRKKIVAERNYKLLMNLKEANINLAHNQRAEMKDMDYSVKAPIDITSDQTF